MRRVKVIALFLFGFAWALSCTPDGDFSASRTRGGSDSRKGEPRDPAEKTWRVMLLVSGGYNDLSGALTADLEEVAQNYLPHGTSATANVLAVLSRLPKNRLSTTTVPVLYTMYRLGDDTVVRDTIRVWGLEDRLFGGTVVKDALTTLRAQYPAGSYGMVISSHGSGWTPPLYYYSPSAFGDNLDDDGSTILWESNKRSVGQDVDGPKMADMTELSLTDLADAIPDGGLEYLMLDCCLCGGVEVAWALRGKTDLVAFSQTEILSDGFDYSSVVGRLLSGPSADVEGVCRDYFEYYDSRSGSYRSATISLVDTRRLQPLATVCAALATKYRSQILALDKPQIQRYYRYHRHFFYDLKDIFLRAGITADEREQLEQALSQCVLYKAATPYFMQGTGYGFPIECHSGFSMYLPSDGLKYLNEYYKENIAWNQVTQIVQ